MHTKMPKASQDSAAPAVVGFLTVLSGPQRGACAPLAENREYVIGHDDACDLVLDDDSIAPRHLALVWHSRRLRLTALEAWVALGDQVLTPGATGEAQPDLVLAVGALHLGLGSEHCDWTKLPWPQPPDPVAPEPAPEQPLGDKEPRVEPEFAPLAQRRQPRDLWVPLLMALGVFAVVALLLMLESGWPFTATPPQAESAASEAQVATQARAILARLGIDDFELSARAGGGLVLTGYSESRALREQVTQAFAAAGLRIDNRLMPEDRLNDLLARTIERLADGQVEHQYLGQGAVRLAGILPSGLSRERFSRLLMQDVPGLAHIEGAVLALDDVLADLRERIRQAGNPLARLTVAIGERGLRLSGRLDTAHEASLTALVEAFAADYPDAPPLELAVDWTARPTEAVVAESAPDLVLPRVLGVMIGANQPPLALLENGRQVGRGDRVAGPYVIEEIRFDQVILSNGKEHKSLRIGASAHD